MGKIRIFVVLMVVSLFTSCATVYKGPAVPLSPFNTWVDYKTSRMELRTYYDPERDAASFANKTFGFEYTDKQNPLLEKELFAILRKEMEKTGLVYSKEKPDILITMNSYIGKKENYVPPQAIVSTTYNSVWTMGMVGWTPTGHTQIVPSVESKTEPGQTIVSYYKNIRLTFLDTAALSSGKKPELPPAVWIGEVEFIDHEKDPVSDIRITAPYMFRVLLEEFPVKSGKGSERYISVIRYGALGIKVDPNDWRKVTEVIQGSPAEAAGIAPGDMIEAVNGKRMARGLGDYANYGLEPKVAFMLNDPYHLNVFNNKEGKEIELAIRKSGSGPKKKVRVIPVRTVQEWLR